jgi:APA family basic amino acid/polyamine antiporter
LTRPQVAHIVTTVQQRLRSTLTAAFLLQEGTIVDKDQRGDPVADLAPITRKATGLVRELSLLDMITYNASIATPLGAAVAFSLFYVFAAFPGANLVIAFIVGLIGIFFTVVTFALLSTAMPRIGGDYAYVSRIVHPSAGLASNLCYLIAATMGAAFVATVGVRLLIAPTLAIVGTIGGYSSWVSASTTIAGNGWTFVIGSLVIIACGAVAVFGTKLAGRITTIMYLIALAGSLVTLLILLFTSRESFVSNLNSFSQPFTHVKDTYQATITAGQKAGLVYPDVAGYSTKSTIGAIFVTYGLTVSAYAGIYLAGEMKGAGVRRRQLSAVLVSGYGQGLLLLISAIAFLHTMGTDFVIAASNGAFPVPVAPYALFFVGVVTGSTVVGALLGAALICCIPPWLYTNAAIAYRVPFAWAFDGLSPTKFTEVNERTHTPVIAIAIVTVLCVVADAWASFSTSFITYFTYLVLLGYFTIIMVGIAGLLMPWRLPAVYNGSQGDWRVAGIPVLPVCGGITVIWNIFVIGLAIYFHDSIGLPNPWTPIWVLTGIALAGVAYYYVARAIQRGRGVNVDLAFKTIPPE